MSLRSVRRWTVQDYLAFERNQHDKHEFAAGQIVLQAGGSRQHALISTNVIAGLHQQLQTRTCTVYGSDIRITIPQQQRYVYADVSVVCGAAQFEDEYEDNLVNPTLIIEVLSTSTERYDRGKKFQAYQTLECFQEYLLIAQDAVLIEHMVRHNDTLWAFEVITDLQATIVLPSIECLLRVADVYAKIAFAPDSGVDPASGA